MRARSASAPSVRRRAEPAGVVDGEGEQAREALDEVALLAARTRSGATSSSAIKPDDRVARAERRVHAAAGQRGESAFVGMDEPVVDEDRVRARERALQRLRQIVIAHVRGEPDAFGELDGPHRLRFVAHEHDQRAETDDGAQPLAHRVDDLAQVERRRQRLRQARAAKRGARWRSPSRRPGRWPRRP